MGALGAAVYVGPALERYAARPWFGALKAVTWDGGGIGVRVDLVDALVAREIAVAVVHLLAQAGGFCDVQDIDIRNGPDDRSNLAHVSPKLPLRGEEQGCWTEGSFEARTL